MMETTDFKDYENSYVNIPIFILKTFWEGDCASFDTFILHVLAFGTATNQIMRLEYDDDGNSEYIAVTQSAKDNIELFLNFIAEVEDYRQAYQLPAFNFDEKISDYEFWFHKHGLNDWTKQEKWVGITVYNLRKMILSRYETDRRKNLERMAQKWMIYLGLKSAIGYKSHFDCSWDFVLCRAMGFVRRKDYEQENIGDKDWSIPFRTKRKTKIKMIERIIDEFGLIYNPTGYKGCSHNSCRWSLKRNTLAHKQGTP